MAETAIVVVVPEAEPAIDLVRRRHTVDGAEGMPPHITLLYPFTDTDLLVSGRIDAVRNALASFVPFNGELDAVARFERPLDTVLWLAPRPAEPLIAIIEALAAQFPEHPPFEGQFPSIVPHLTVAVSDDPDLLDRIEADLGSQLPIQIRVQEVALYEHTAGGWRLRTRVPLKSS